MNLISAYFSRRIQATAMLAPLIAMSILTIGLTFTPNQTIIAMTPPYAKLSSALLEEIASKGDTSIKVLVETTTNNYASALEEINTLGGTVSHKFSHVNALAVELPANMIELLAVNPNIVRIQLDTIRYPAARPRMLLVDPGGSIKNPNKFDIRSDFEVTLDFPMEKAIPITLTAQDIDLLEPDTYWNPVAMGAVPIWGPTMLGMGSLAVIIDTGVYADHFMLSGSVIGGVDLSPDAGTPAEGYSNASNHWHGTHVAGILAGSGAVLIRSSHPLYGAISQYGAPPPEASSIPSGIGYPGYHVVPLLGMAPFADIFAVKVFPQSGAGVPESFIIAGMEYALNMSLYWGYDVDVVSMSIGGPTLYDGRDLEDTLVETMVSHGLTMAIAAGNEGPAPRTVTAPGTANSAITAAAAAHPVNTRVFWDYFYGKPGIGHQLFMSDTPQIYAFSSRGPTSDGRAKPDVSATGIFVLSAYHETGLPQEIAWASGTSMATPAVSGTVALLNAYSEMNALGASPEDYKQAITGSATWLPGYTAEDQGAGYINAASALGTLVTDSSLGDSPPPLPPAPAVPTDISNIPIVGAGTYTDRIDELAPGHKVDYVFKATDNTDSIKLEITKVDLRERNPYRFNSFEVYIHSAKRAYYDYWVDSANVWGKAEFHVTDAGATWTGAVTGGTPLPPSPPSNIESGYVKITIENDWTSSGPASAEIEITVTSAPLPTPDFSDSGTVNQDQMLVYGFHGLPIGKTSITLELDWINDWTKYPSSDLDLYVWWYNGTSWHFAGYAAATLNIPERITISDPSMVGVWIQIYGYAIYTSPGPNGEPGGTESWTLNIVYG